MHVRWYLYRFDYARYLRMRPLLRAATTPAAFAVLAEGPEVDAIIEALENEDMPLPMARSALVRAICCRGEPLPFDTGLSRLVIALERTPGLEDAAALLGEMLSGARNLEPWMLPAAGLAGLLTPQEASTVYTAYKAVSRRTLRQARVPGVRSRRGGLLAACLGLLRHLRDSDPQPDDMLLLLRNLLEEAVNKDEGIAAVDT